MIRKVRPLSPAAALGVVQLPALSDTRGRIRVRELPSADDHFDGASSRPSFGRAAGASDLTAPIIFRMTVRDAKALAVLWLEPEAALTWTA
jgi:hypothetical protein